MTVDLDGPVHYVDFGGADGGPAVVLVHGLGGSHLNWDLLAPLLTPHARVLALDLPGFGRSEPAGRRAGVPANVLVLDRFLREVVPGPVVLVGNSMGGMISLFEAARSPQRVRGTVLLDPAVPGARRAPDPAVALHFALYAVPFLAERALWFHRTRRSPLRRVRELLELCGVDPDAVPAEVVDRSVTLLEERRDVAGMDKAFLAAARSLLWVLADPRRYREAMASIAGPVLLLHGDRDRLVPVEASRDIAARHPDWRYVELAGVGHVPQLQVPDVVAGHLLDWLRDSGLVSPAGRGPAERS
ncbi:Pimeloyl-ACP methyl ester carboxylesterase [Trujillonella endophytica]|uniref:Pimeloyl-ACP methyl ester carboxylesterase n=2 Tax=Trujillonella endophytica TaxID=673521 RepID=A0A1H8VS12_9ACTN|nr:Pimeloyl-ACP methyl ester carboxylesterase [Trujillella endophytica]